MKITFIILLGLSFYAGIITEKAYKKVRKTNANAVKKIYVNKLVQKKCPTSDAILGLRTRLENCSTQLEKTEEELNYLSSTEYEERLCGPKEEEVTNEESK